MFPDSTVHNFRKFLRSIFIKRVIFISLLAGFALTPQIDDYKKTSMMGWSMFSGTNARDPIFYFEAKNSSCMPPPDLMPLIVTIQIPQGLAFRSFSFDLIDRFRSSYVRNCNGLNASKIIQQPSLAEQLNR